MSQVGAREAERLRLTREYETKWYLENENINYVALYQPRGKWSRMHLRPPGVPNGPDLWAENGIPHRVSVPGHTEEYIPFQRWMMRICRGWWQRVDGGNPAPHNPDLFDGINDQDHVNFFRVMEHRISVQRAHAKFTRWADSAQRRALTTEIADEGRAMGHANARRELVAFSLMGLTYKEDPNEFNNEMTEIARFVNSPAVREPFKEYWEDYLLLHQDTGNARWNTIQPALVDRTSPQITKIRKAVYGETMEERDRLQKKHWSHEDHAIRFIITLYKLGENQFTEAGIDAVDARDTWRSYFFSYVGSPDFHDRHWFGFSLLNLLMKSWQYNLVNPYREYSLCLIPALYNGFRPRTCQFPAVEVGRIDLSPYTRWVWQPDYRSTIDSTVAMSRGLISVDQKTELEEEESDRGLLDDGHSRRT
ncbi:hypothetical protein GGR54DRAFT_636077 [Hypoxylon sp. NC1633]|nr:hypothetical protein GGR54DRAFT_636077 [Hypoxylon sp. NC1633]